VREPQEGHRNFFAKVTQQPDAVWQAVPAVSNKRVYLAPTVPFGWIDGPPSVNRLIGLAWLANIFNELTHCHRSHRLAIEIAAALEAEAGVRQPTEHKKMNGHARMDTGHILDG
jgi:hypothetical protein